MLADALRARGVLAASVIVILALLAVSPVRAADAEYRIGVGDTLALWVAGAPELNMRLPVGINGTIVVPLGGEAHVAGLTLSQARVNVSAMLTRHTLLRSAADGRSIGVTIGYDQILLTIVEYRPIYVTGDVAKAGAQEFRPGMTVRQAIALAGGYDLLRSTGANPLLDAFDLRSQQETLWIAYAQTLADVRRTEAEIDDADFLNVEDDLSRVPIGADVRVHVAQSAVKQFQFQTEDVRDKKLDFAREANLEKKGIAVLTDELQKENAGAEQDQKDLSSMEVLYKNNTIPMNRLLDARRTVLLSSTRALQILSQLNLMERQADEADQATRQFTSQRRLTLTQQLQEGHLRLATLRSKLDATADKLLYASNIKSQFAAGFSRTRKATIDRDLDGRRTQFVVQGDSLLAPGDVIEVTFDAALLTPPPAASE